MFAALLKSVQPTVERYQSVCSVLGADHAQREVDIEMGEIKTPDDSSPLKLILSAGYYGFHELSPYKQGNEFYIRLGYALDGCTIEKPKSLKTSEGDTYLASIRLPGYR